MSSFYTTLSGLNAFHTQISQISNNLANLETTAYKSNDMTFEEVLATTMTLNSASSVVAGKGVSILGSSTNWEQGDLMATGNTTDLAITGEGFFAVEDTAGTVYYTRDGSFHYDENGVLRNDYDMVVQGYSYPYSTGAALVDIALPATPTYITTTIDKYGVVSGTQADGTVDPLFQIALVIFPNKDGLDKVYDGLYIETGPSGNPIDGPAGSGQYGKITSEALEVSNVDMAAEMADLVIAQRAYEACAKAMTTESEILQTTTQML
jgi:flagellar hook protein FlgE